MGQQGKLRDQQLQKGKLDLEALGIKKQQRQQWNQILESDVFKSGDQATQQQLAESVGMGEEYSNQLKRINSLSDRQKEAENAKIEGEVNKYAAMLQFPPEIAAQKYNEQLSALGKPANATAADAYARIKSNMIELNAVTDASKKALAATKSSRPVAIKRGGKNIYVDPQEALGEEKAGGATSAGRVIETTKGYSRVNEDNSLTPILDKDGNQVRSQSTANAIVRDENAKKNIELRKQREKTRRDQLALRKKSYELRDKKHTDKLYGEFADDFRTDTKVLNGMTEEIEGAQSILSKKNPTPADTATLQRFLAGVRKANTRAQSEIDAWSPGEVGDLIERIEGSLSGFFAGEYSERENAMTSRALDELMDNFINPAYERFDTFYSMKAKRRGMNPDEIIRDRYKGEKKIPKAGDVKGDYKFLGGDPAIKDNWEKI